jgi:hypothetical protein
MPMEDRGNQCCDGVLRRGGGSTLLLWSAWSLCKGSPSYRDRRPSTAYARHLLSRAISSIKKNKRLTICFLCLGNPALPIRERVVSYATPGSLTRHFNRKYVSKIEEWEPSICWMCDVKLEHRQHLQNHTERFYGTVSRRSA